MKVFILLLGTVAIASGRSKYPAQTAIGRHGFNHIGSEYSYSWKTDDGSKRNAKAEIRNKGQENELNLRGSYSYLGPDGVVYIVRYIPEHNEEYHIPISLLPEGALGDSAGGGALDGFGSGAPPVALGGGAPTVAFGFPPAALATLSGGGLG